MGLAASEYGFFCAAAICSNKGAMTTVRHSKQENCTLCVHSLFGHFRASKTWPVSADMPGNIVPNLLPAFLSFWGAWLKNGIWAIFSRAAWLHPGDDSWKRCPRSNKQCFLNWCVQRVVRIRKGRGHQNAWKHGVLEHFYPSDGDSLCRKPKSGIWKTPFGKHRLESFRL